MPEWTPEWRLAIRRRLVGLDLDPAREAAIVEEISQDLDDCYAEYVAGGATEAEARRLALAELRGSETLRHELRGVERRVPQDPIEIGGNQRSNMITDLWQDLRFGARMLMKKPGYTAVAALTLALGIGANTAIFSVINSVLIKSLPYPDSERLVNVWEMRPDGGKHGVSGGAFKDWRAHSSQFAGLAMMKDLRMNLTGTGSPEHLSGLQVTSEFLSVLGVSPTIGRGFVAGEDAIGGNNRVIILTNSFWQRRYGGTPGVIGQTIALNQTPYTVIGVLPPGVLPRDEAEFVVPFVVDVDSDTVKWTRDYHCCGVIGRVKPGATALSALEELRGIKRLLNAEYPPGKKDWSVMTSPVQEDLTGDIRPTLVILLGTVGLVLLIACANVSNLTLARAAARAREMAIRSALGAKAGRIIRQLIIESLLLAFIGCAMGLLLASFGVKLLTDMLTGMVPQMLRPELNLNVLAFSVLLACGCGLLFGILPAVRASKPDLNHALKETERGSMSASKRRSQSILVVSEFALTLVLLVGAGLFLRSFIRLLETDPGFNPKQAVAFDLSFSRAKYPKAEDQQRFLNDVAGRISALPGVESVGSSTTPPMSSRGRGGSISRADKPESESYSVNDEFVSGDYFSALQIKTLRGRVITEADNLPTAPPVMVIDAKIARDLYPNEDPIGKTLRYGPKTWEVVGVVSPVRHWGLNIDPSAKIYGPRTHFSYPISAMVVRSALAPASLIETVRKTILSVDPDQPIANVRTLEQDVRRSLAKQRTTLILLGLFAIVAICLACIGIYGVMSYAVGQRARELSIRAALGASRGAIVSLVLTGGMRLAAIGIAVGLAAAFALTRLVEKLLFQVKTHDPLVFVASVVLLGVVAAFSIYIPARRAARLDPIEALRSE